jgi:hypothetical protein
MRDLIGACSRLLAAARTSAVRRFRPTPPKPVRRKRESMTQAVKPATARRSSRAREVWVGVDTHRDVNVAVSLDERGRKLR